MRVTAGNARSSARTVRRCAARDWLEDHHHDTPYALGGAATADNLRLACRAHNALHTELDFGRSSTLRKFEQVRAQRASAACHQVNARPLQQLPSRTESP